MDLIVLGMEEFRFVLVDSLSFHLNNSSTEISTRKHTRDRKIINRVKLSFTRIIFVEMANNRVDRFVVKIGQLDYFTSIIQSHANKWTGITTLVIVDNRSFSGSTIQCLRRRSFRFLSLSWDRIAKLIKINEESHKKLDRRNSIQCHHTV